MTPALHSVLLAPSRIFFVDAPDDAWCALQVWRLEPAGLDGSFHVRLASMERDVLFASEWLIWNDVGLFHPNGTQLLFWMRKPPVTAAIDLLDDCQIDGLD